MTRHRFNNIYTRGTLAPISFQQPFSPILRRSRSRSSRARAYGENSRVSLVFLSLLPAIDFSISKMQKLGFPSMKSLDQLKSLTGTAKAFSFSSHPPGDSMSAGSFANLKLTAGFFLNRKVFCCLADFLGKIGRFLTMSCKIFDL